MKLILQILLPLAVLAGATWFVSAKIASVQKPKIVAPPVVVPLVRTVVATPQPLQLDVHSQGTVEARTEVALSAQVGGRLASVSPSLRAGGFFAAGEPLLHIEDTDYRLRVVQRRADVARAELKLAQEQAESEAAIRAWHKVEGDKEPDDLAARRLQVEDAKAALDAAKAAQQQAELDLLRTAVSLPFAGRVRSSKVDVGQMVQPGAELARVYATDFAEVRLPIPDDDAAFVDLPLDSAGAEHGAGNHPPVTLTTRFGGQDHTWTGVVDRTEGEIDRRTRQLTVVARIADPYSATGERDRPPLAVGMFVEAAIQGRRFDDVVVLPRSAVRPDGTVLVIGPENHLTARKVDVLRLGRAEALVRGGLAAGELVCVSNIESFVEGMAVSLLHDDGSVVAPPQQGPSPTAERSEDK